MHHLFGPAGEHGPELLRHQGPNCAVLLRVQHYTRSELQRSFEEGDRAYSSSWLAKGFDVTQRPNRCNCFGHPALSPSLGPAVHGLGTPGSQKDMGEVGVSASAAAWLGSCSYAHEPVCDSFGCDDGQCCEREIFDAGQGLVPFTCL